MSSKFEIKGHKELSKKLERMGKEIIPIIRKESRKACKIVQAEAKKLAPKESGTLKRSIKVRSMKRSRVRVGSTCQAKIPYAAPLEYGTKYIEAREFMLQASKNKGEQAIRQAIDGIKAGITKEAKK